MIKKFIKISPRIAGLTGVLVLLSLGIPNLVAEWYTRARIFPPEQAPSAPIAIVFGAGLTRDGRPTPVLRDRVSAAAQLYFSGKVEKLLMSGDNRFVDYNEPGAMRTYALSLGVPDDAIILDYAGRRTYDTCYRARHIFGVSRALLVTQQFHLPRAVFTCNALGIQGNGVIADQRTYSRFSRHFWRIREIPATARAFVDVYVTRPLPVLGEPEPIFALTQNEVKPIR